MQRQSDGKWFSSEYWSFHIGDELTDKYRLDVDGFRGDGGNILMTAGNYLHDGMMFTTYDRDNDLFAGGSCTNPYGSWWFNNCHKVCLTCNGAYHRSYHLSEGILVNSRMMIKPR